MASKIVTINGKIRDHKYKFRINPTLPEINFIQAMQKNRKVFESTFLDREKVAISVWTTPKRTKTYPFARVYDTLSYDGIKVTIIPAMVDYGANGERGKIQPNTIDWMTSVGVYLILGVYIDADKGEVGKLAAHANKDTKSREGSPKFAQGQRFDLGDIQAQIEKIIETKPKVKEWNDNQLTKIPNLLANAIDIYKKLGKKLDVPLGNFTKLEKEVAIWKKNSVKFLLDCEENSKGAQDREANSIHKLEDVPGEKGKINIDFGDTRKLYLTSDNMELDEEKGTVVLLERKNTSSGKYPVWPDVKDALIKLMIFKNSDFSIGDKRLKKKLVCYLTGKGKMAGFKEEYQSLIQECDANDIELKFNKKIVK